jgi:hypothetical protein
MKRFPDPPREGLDDTDGGDVTIPTVVTMTCRPVLKGDSYATSTTISPAE